MRRPCRALYAEGDRTGERYAASVDELDIYDRVGDGFAFGFFQGLTGAPAEETVRLGWAHGALLTTFFGGTTMASLEQVKAFAQCGSCRVINDLWSESVVCVNQ